MPHITIRVTEEERTNYKKAVEAKGMSMTEAIKFFLDRLVKSVSQKKK